MKPSFTWKRILSAAISSSRTVAVTHDICRGGAGLAKLRDWPRVNASLEIQCWRNNGGPTKPRANELQPERPTQSTLPLRCCSFICPCTGLSYISNYLWAMGVLVASPVIGRSEHAMFVTLEPLLSRMDNYIPNTQLVSVYYYLMNPLRSDRGYSVRVSSHSCLMLQ